MRTQIKSILSIIFFRYTSSTPLPQWNYWLGRIYNVKLQGKVKSFSEPTAGCSANINIIMDLLERSNKLPGDIAECGVFQGATLVPLTHYMNLLKDTRQIYGFDSFEGFGKAAEVESETDLTGHIDIETVMFEQTSIGLIQNKLRLTQTNTNRLNLVKGYFENSLPTYNTHNYSFVHLDCDLASSYLTCLEFFFPRMNKGGIILFDEYLDPIYTSATETIDTYFADKFEKPIRIESDNYVKYYILKN
jgi:O-methyltransferase